MLARDVGFVVGVDDLLAPDVGRHLQRAVVAPLAHEACGSGQGHAAGHVEVSCDGGEGHEAVPSLHAVRAGVDGEAPHERNGLGGGDGARSGQDGL